MVEEVRRRQYLQAMGITVWERRDPRLSGQPVAIQVGAVLPASNMAESANRVKQSPTLDTSSYLHRTPEPAACTSRAPVRANSVSEVSRRDAREGAGGIPAAPLGREAQGEDSSVDQSAFVSHALEADQRQVAPFSATQPSLIAKLDWASLRERVKNCRACGLREGCTQTVFGVGNTEADLLIVGEAPGAEEDRQGEPFVGRAGQLLNAMLLAIGFQREQVFIANILKCRPPNNRDPKPEEALQCEPFLLRQIGLIQPKVILSAGRISAQNLLKTDIAVGKLRGRVHHFGDRAIPLVVTYHPAYLLRSPEQKAKTWDDLQLVLTLLRG
jgi:DNA polymerase